jgi:DNA-binding transcriptional LysR family regulator
MSDPLPRTRPRLVVGFVPGVTVTKWRTVWAERFPRTRLDVVEVAAADQRRALDAGEVDLCFVRLPIDTQNLHLIQLWEELPVIWASKDHPVAAFEEIALSDLGDEVVLTDASPASIDLAGVGEAVLHVPQSVARTHSRRDFIYRMLTDAPSTTVGLAWLPGNPNELVEEFIGIVRGRTANSSRTVQARAAKPSATKPAPAPPPKPAQRAARGRRPRRRG